MQASGDRRQFIKLAGSAAAGLLAASYSTESARGYAANDTLQVGAIGVGGRCRQLLGATKQIPGVKITAVCDVWDQNLAEAKKLADPAAFSTKAVEELLARKDVDAVIIGAPDHQHVPLTILACQAGKDVYVEKPLTHDLSEGAAVVAAQNDHKRIVQVGMQQRSMPHIQEGFEIIRSGAIGKVHKVHLTWNRNANRGKRQHQIDPATVDWKRFLGTARQQEFDPYRFREWRWFWDFGGGIFTDLMVHFIDVANWYLDLGQPTTAASVGNHFLNEGVWETPDTVQTLMTYPEQKVQVYFEGTFINARNAAMLEFMGTDGTLYLDRGRYELHPERTSKFQYREQVLGSGPRGADFYNAPDGKLLHVGNWVECVRSRKQPVAPAEAGVSAAAAAHCANLALRGGGHWKAKG